MKELETEVEVVSQMISKLVTYNAVMPQDQDAYQEKYRNLADRYEALIVELKSVEKQHLDKAKRNKEIREFLEALKVQEGLVTEFDDFLWETMVDRAIINHEKSVTISLKNKMVVII
ncbi:hypothetical protein HMPREF3112_09155 [Streptococcus sp. HMSC10E12]|nr:hypothetical protein HMPREF3112_09155 [Streptococcus sp. HMSC10E12]